MAAKMNNAVMDAADWILNSGIQNLKGDQKGGFNSWYDLEQKKYEFLYSEITGYAITMLLYLNKISPNKVFVDRGKLAADWLLSKAIHPVGGVRTRHYYDLENAHPGYSFESEILYAFDNGIVAFGLANLYDETKEKKYLDAAEGIMQFLMRKMQKPNGEFYASYDAKSENLGDDDSKWSTQSGSYHAKISLPLVKLFELTRKQEYKDSAIKVCEASLKVQEKDGRFVTYRTEKDTHIHPHCYSAEGLLYAGIKLDKPKFIESAARAADWVLQNLNDDGSILCLYSNHRKGFVTYERSDTLAQTLRLASILAARNMLKTKISSKKLSERVGFFHKKDGIQKGGFYYGWQEGKYLAYLNSWCTMFALQALQEYDDKSGDVELLV